MAQQKKQIYKIVVRFPFEMQAKLTKRSRREMRSINATIVKLVMEGLDTPYTKRKYEKREQ